MPSDRLFGDDSTKATRFHEPDDGDDRMNENDDDVEHAGIVSNLKNSQNSGRFWNSPPTGFTRSVSTLQSPTSGVTEPLTFLEQFRSCAAFFGLLALGDFGLQALVDPDQSQR